jgi:hypothetical protein
MRTSKEALISALFRQTIFGILVVALSLPLVRVLHERFSLGPPPASVLVLMGLAVMSTFWGAGAIGALWGAGNRRGSMGAPILAALLSLGLSLLVCGVVVPTYGGMVADHLLQEGATGVLRDRGRLLGQARESYDDVRSGRSREITRDLSGEALNRGKSLVRSGAARLPALSLLLWTLVLPPLGAAFEARRASRR